MLEGAEQPHTNASRPITRNCETLVGNGNEAHIPERILLGNIQGCVYSYSSKLATGFAFPLPHFYLVFVLGML
jgi:hypothetical protein